MREKERVKGRGCEKKAFLLKAKKKAEVESKSRDGIMVEEEEEKEKEGGTRRKSRAPLSKPGLNVWLPLDCRSIWLFSAIQTALLFGLVSALGK